MSRMFDPDEAPTNPWSRQAVIQDRRRALALLLPERTVVTPSPFDAPFDAPDLPAPPDPLGGGPTRVTPYAQLPVAVAAPPSLTFLPGHDSAVELPCLEDHDVALPTITSTSTPASWSSRSEGSLVPLRSVGRGAFRSRPRDVDLADDVDVDDLERWTLAGRFRGAWLGLCCLACRVVALLLGRPPRALDAWP